MLRRVLGAGAAALALTACTSSGAPDGDGSTTSTSGGDATTSSSTTSADGTASSTSRSSHPGRRLPRSLRRDLQDVRSAHPDAEVSVAVMPVDGDGPPRVVGHPPTLVAWSTMKVPIALAIERAGLGEEAAGDVEQAITASDNAAAARLWDRLGGGTAASRATEEQLRRGGDRTTRVPSQVTIPGYSPFGQSKWRLRDQVHFTAELPCLAGSDRVSDAMGHVVPGQQWGLGSLSGARFKGGWGPTPEGYVVRQLGVLPSTKGDTAVALQVRGANHGSTTAVATELAEVLGRHADDLPTGSCA